MGHFIPIQNCATSLKEAGHDVYMITNGNDYIKEKTKGFEDKYGIQMAFTDCGLTNEDALREPKGKCEDPINTYMVTWLPHLRKTMKEVAPDIIVCDFTSSAGIIVGDEMNIPVVINVPGSLRIFMEFGILEFPDMSKASTCCGMICMKKSMKHACIQFMLPKLMKLTYPTLKRS